MDPRIKGMETKMKGIKKIIPVVSGKGGVGKSLVSTVLALLLSKKGYSVGLLDLDFYGASDHIILGYKPTEIPGEDKGVIPPIVHGIKFMSIIYYSENHPLPMRGKEVSDALIEIMAITRWDDLDFLIIDMPPGLGEQFLDLLRFIHNGNFLIVSTSSPLSINVVEKLIELLQESKKRHSILGIIENMKLNNEDHLMKLAEKYNIKYLTGIPFYQNLDEKIGNIDNLMKSDFAKKIEEVINNL